MTATKAIKLGITDILATAFIFLVPALSHMTSVPFYLADPMRLAVLGALAASRDWKNSLALAIALPLISFGISGHPVFPKCLLIAVELASNVLLFAAFHKSFAKFFRRGRAFGTGCAAFLSILLSKGIYYLLKFALISGGLMDMELVSTALLVQLAVAIVLSVLLALSFRRS